MNLEPVQPNIVYYEKKNVSVLEFRFEELKMAGIGGFTMNTSFQHLFEKRLSTMNVSRTKIQITLNIDIQSDDNNTEDTWTI